MKRVVLLFVVLSLALTVSAVSAQTAHYQVLACRDYVQVNSTSMGNLAVSVYYPGNPGWQTYNVVSGGSIQFYYGQYSYLWLHVSGSPELYIRPTTNCMPSAPSPTAHPPADHGVRYEPPKCEIELQGMFSFRPVSVVGGSAYTNEEVSIVARTNTSATHTPEGRAIFYGSGDAANPGELDVLALCTDWQPTDCFTHQGELLCISGLYDVFVRGTHMLTFSMVAGEDVRQPYLHYLNTRYLALDQYYRGLTAW